MTPEAIARLAIARTGVQMSAALASRFVSTRWETIASLFRLKLLRTNGVLTLPARYTTGTITATRGSPIVTGTATAWTSALVDRHFRAATAWYRITQVQSATSLILEADFGETTVTDGAYNIIQRFYTLPATLKHLGDPMTHQRLFRRVWMRPQDEIDLYAPARSLTGNPLYFADIGVEDGKRLIEVYPGGGNAIDALHYFGWKKPEPLQFHEDVPLFLDPSVLRAGVEADLLRVKGVALIETNAQAGQVMLNEARRQETEFVARLPRAIRDAKALDDTQVKIQLAGARGGRGLFGSDISTARDLVWSRDA